ncbi:MAG: hypothetical protein AB7K68_15190 [Bacteriovoracia bacterium]
MTPSRLKFLNESRGTEIITTYQANRFPDPDERKSLEERLAPEPISFKGPPGLQGKRRSFMDQNSNYITIEMNLRLQMKDYRMVLGMKRTWIVALVVGAIQLIAYAIKRHS